MTNEELIAAKIGQLKSDRALKEIRLRLEKAMDGLGLEKEKDYMIKGRYKDLESAVEKMSRKQYQDVGQITDLIGLKVVLLDRSRIPDARLALLSAFPCRSENNYYEKARPDGYEALHLDLEHAPGSAFELQLKDKLSDLAQSFCHTNIYKNERLNYLGDMKPELNRRVNHSIGEYYQDCPPRLKQTAEPDMGDLNAILDYHKHEIDGELIKQRTQEDVLQRLSGSALKSWGIYEQEVGYGQASLDGARVEYLRCAESGDVPEYLQDLVAGLNDAELKCCSDHTQKKVEPAREL